MYKEEEDLILDKNEKMKENLAALKQLNQIDIDELIEEELEE